MKKFAKSVVNYFTVDKDATNVAIIQYSTSVEVVCTFETSRKEGLNGVNGAIDNMR